MHRHLLYGCMLANNEGLCLTLPGSQLDVSVMLKDKKFRGRGNKEGALQALRKLDEDGLGKLQEKQTKGSIKVLWLNRGPVNCCEQIVNADFQTFHVYIT